jgi:PST family polysaccharide transporter
MNLREQTVHGVQWNTAAQVGQQVTQLVTLAVLGRLLSPEDFGLLGMATVITGFALLFNDLGTSAAVIQQRDPSEELLSSIFWANLLFGALLSLVVLLGAPVVAAYYRDPRVTPVLRVLALMFPISALGTLQKSLLEKRMAFHLTAHIEVAAVAVGAIVAIALAIAHAGVWALVAQSLTIFAATSACSGFFLTGGRQPYCTGENCGLSAASASI